MSKCKDLTIHGSYKGYQVRLSMLSTTRSVKGAVDYLMSKGIIEKTFYETLKNDLVDEIDNYIEEEKNIIILNRDEVSLNDTY
jgi:hypothetical protein